MRTSVWTFAASNASLQYGHALDDAAVFSMQLRHDSPPQHGV
jgi:hypothetical protein